MNSRFDMLLAGAGHAHLGVLRHWLDGRRPDGRIGLLNDGVHAWYSGMLPGLLAGRYRPEQCRVELDRLCAAVGVELLQGKLCALSANDRTLTLSDGRQCSASWLSLNLGAQPPALTLMDSQLQLLPVKPFAGFFKTWWQWRQAPEPLAILGAGAAGVELALALASQVPALSLISAGEILSGYPTKLRSRALRRLNSAGVAVLEQVTVDCVRGDALLAGQRVVWRGRRAILASGASPLPWLREAGLACDTQGFVRVDKHLQSLSHSTIFAVGDCASLADTPRSGVYAVRQGPVLAENLRAASTGQPLRGFVPQRRALALLDDGQGGALLSWAGMTAEGRALGWWKTRLDQRFIRRHSRPPKPASG